MRQYETFEISFQALEPEGSWSVTDLTAEFMCNGKTTKVSGFYAGNGIYKVRYLPRETGMISWKTEGIFCAEGCEECIAQEDGIHHGLVRPNGTALCFWDGTPCRTFGTTVYGMLHQPKALIARTIETLKSSPFNKVRTCVFPKHYIFNENEPEYFAFEKKAEGGFDFHRPCMAFWDALDEALKKLQESQVQVDLILFHPYDCWGFSKMTRKEQIPYLAYLSARLSAIPNVWWSLANEYDSMSHFTKEDWEFIDTFISAHDPYSHMMSCHHMLEMYDFSRPQITHVSVQGDVLMVEELMRTYHKPVLMDEFGYEGNIECHWGHLSAFEEVHKFWLCCVMGGYATHGETFLDENDVLWWGKGGTLKGQSPARIGFLRSILEELPGALEPVCGRPIVKEEFLTNKQSIKADEMSDLERALLKHTPNEIREIVKNLERDTRIYTGHCGEEAYLQYYGRHCTAVGSLTLPEHGSYRIEVLDVWNMTRNIVLTGVSGHVKFALPGKEGTAVLAVKEGK